MSGAAGAVQNEHGIGCLARRISLRLAERGVMQPQFRKRLSGLEVKVMRDEVAFRGQQPRRSGSLLAQQHGRKKKQRCNQIADAPQGQRHEVGLRNKFDLSSRQLQTRVLSASPQSWARTATRCRLRESESYRRLAQPRLRQQSLLLESLRNGRSLQFSRESSAPALLP